MLPIFHPGPYGVLLDHLIDREMLAHLAQEREDIHVLIEISVIDDQGRVGPRSKVEELFGNLPDAFQVVVNLLFSLKASFLRLEARIPNQAGRAAQNYDRSMPGLLEAPKGDQREQASHVKGVARRIKSAIERNWARIELLMQGRVSKLVENSSGFEVVQQWVTHGVTLPELGFETNLFGTGPEMPFLFESPLVECLSLQGNGHLSKGV